MVESCDLCGLQVETEFEDDEGNLFCCRGCRKVFGALGETDISREELFQYNQESELSDDELDRILDEGAEEVICKVDGMWCSTCEDFIQQSISRKEGIKNVDASFSSEMARVVYDPEETDTDSIFGFFKKLGYKARFKDEEAPDYLYWARWLFGGTFGMMVMMIYLITIYPVHLGFYRETGYAYGFVSTGANLWLGMFTLPVLFFAGYPILRSAYVSIRAGAPNMNTLVSIGAISALLYSFHQAFQGTLDLYFDIPVLLVLIMMSGKALERSIKKGSTKAVERLMEEGVSDARMESGEEVPIECVERGDQLLVKQGEKIPVDGVVVEGESAVDESLFSGESLPVEKVEGDEVTSGTVNEEGVLVVEAARVGSDTALSRLVKELWKIQSSKPSIQRTVDRVAGYFVPAVIVLAVATFGFYYVVQGSSFQFALLTGMAVLLASCPCALGLAAPMALFSGFGRATDEGIIVRDLDVLERGRNVDVVLLDKTSTVTEGEMSVSSVEADDRDEVLGVAAALETFSDHPIAEAVVEEAGESGGFESSADSFEPVQGFGVRGMVDLDGSEEEVLVGSPEMMEDEGIALSGFEDGVDRVRGEGGTAICVAWGGEMQGLLGVSDTIRDEAAAAVAEMEARGLEVHLLTGDSREAGETVGEEIGVDEVHAEVKPDEKADVVRSLKNEGHTVAMVGDGVNDSLALAAADVGIAIGSGADVALESGDAAAVEDDLYSIVKIMDISDKSLRKIRQNLGWAFTYNMVAIPLAMTGFLNPLIAAAAMLGSSVIVVTNSVRPRNMLSGLVSGLHPEA